MKLLIASLITAFSLTANAVENWVLVDDSADGETRLIVDSESFSIIQDSKNKKAPDYIAAMFRTIEGGKTNEFAMVIELRSCSKTGGEIVQRRLVNGTWATVGKYFWSKSGMKLYDVSGQTLCDILEVRRLEQDPKPNRRLNT